MTARTCLAIVLAAGEGTRMRSARPKVLHPLAGRSLLAHVLGTIGQAGVTATAVVIGADKRVTGLPGCGLGGQVAVSASAVRRRNDSSMIWCCPSNRCASRSGRLAVT